MAQTSNSLLRRSPFLPGESLPSLAVRLAQRNYVTSIASFTNFCLQGTQDKQLVRPVDPLSFRRLARLTQLPISALMAASVHPFAPILTPPEIGADTVHIEETSYPLLSEKLYMKQVRPPSKAQFCPLCLHEQAYHRLIWFPIAVSACLKHACLLVNHCPDCGHSISIADLHQATCKQCHYDLTQIPTVTLVEDTVGLNSQQVIQQWFTEQTDVDTPHQLPNQPTSVLFRVMEGFRFTILRDPHHERYLHQLPNLPTLNIPPEVKNWQKLSSAQCYLLYTTALQPLFNWPHGFTQFLDAFRRISTHSHKRLKDELGILYSQWFRKHWRDSRYQFLQAEFDHYLLTRFEQSASLTQSRRFRERPEFSQQFSHILVKEAAQLLNTSQKTINRLVKTGRLVEHKAGNGYRFVEREAVLVLAQRWQQSLSLCQTIDLLGLKERVVLALLKREVLVAERGPHLDGYQWRVSQASIETLEQSIRQHSISANGKAYSVNLTSAAHQVACVGLKLVDLIEAVSRGRLPAYLPVRVNVGQVHFKPADVQTLIKQVRVKNGWLTWKMVYQRLQVNPATLTQWIRLGLLTPTVTYGKAYYFAETTVTQFEHNYLNSHQAAQILQIGLPALRRWVAQGRLNAVETERGSYQHYLFHRAEMERLSPARRLSLTQMAQQLNLSRSQTLQWVKEDKLKPISGPGVDGCKHYLFEAPT
ncbi:excisionase family DNA-binding protein [Anaerolineales bacterium HSG6]|nr:excisionase family DNA-binding protein [Anaerolineales bacterium HSG6]